MGSLPADTNEDIEHLSAHEDGFGPQEAIEDLPLSDDELDPIQLMSNSCKLLQGHEGDNVVGHRYTSSILIESAEQEQEPDQQSPQPNLEALIRSLADSDHGDQDTHYAPTSMEFSLCDQGVPSAQVPNTEPLEDALMTDSPEEVGRLGVGTTDTLSSESQSQTQAARYQKEIQWPKAIKKAHQMWEQCNTSAEEKADHHRHLTSLGDTGLQKIALTHFAHAQHHEGNLEVEKDDCETNLSRWRSFRVTNQVFWEKLAELFGWNEEAFEQGRREALQNAFTTWGYKPQAGHKKWWRAYEGATRFIAHIEKTTISKKKGFQEDAATSGEPPRKRSRRSSD